MEEHPLCTATALVCLRWWELAARQRVFSLSQKPVLGPEIARKTALKELFQRKREVSAPKLWIAPGFEKNQAKEEAIRTQKAIDAEIQKRQKQERLPSPERKTQGQRVWEEFDLLEPPNMEVSGQGMGAAKQEEQLDQLAPEGNLGGPSAQDAGIPVPAMEEPTGPEEEAGGPNAEGEAQTEDPMAQLISAVSSWEQQVMSRRKWLPVPLSVFQSKV
ncbi:uncharacterized protein LOC143828382 [Paroedura picta]|uniref:uncharacterized protein LOC143828382 n=1 Tax=Paroedura picta TaxID=143630 RepID=UPI004057319D